MYFITHQRISSIFNITLLSGFSKDVSNELKPDNKVMLNMDENPPFSKNCLIYLSFEDIIIVVCSSESKYEGDWSNNLEQ